MNDNPDDILDISFDDEASEPTPAEDVLQIELDAAPPLVSTVAVASPKPPASPASQLPDGSKTDSPMVAGGVCTRCGYALRPLEEQCPRCARLGPASASPPSVTGTESLPPAEEASLPPVQPRRGCVVMGAVGAVLLLAIAVGIPIAIWMQPSQQAKREYRLGLQDQLHSDFEGARRHYQKALSLDPDMGLAAFSMGTTYLEIGDPGLMDSIQDLTKRAAEGETAVLDSADEWFRKTLEIGQRLSPDKRLTDQRIRTPAQLRAFAHASLALTALIRASGAMQADQLDAAMAWFGVVSREAQLALLDDPTNSAADKILRSVQPILPPAS